VGDVMFDVALYYGKIAEEHSSILQQLNLDKKHYVLATIHRPDNTDDKERIEIIFKAFRKIAEHMTVVMPLHPRTLKMLSTFNLIDNLPSGLKLIDPLGFLDMIMLEKNACVIATDSGGVQKEAFFHQVPCVVLYEKTVWVELVELGWNQVVLPTNVNNIVEAICQLKSKVGCLNTQPYGDGHAAEKIVELF